MKKLFVAGTALAAFAGSAAAADLPVKAPPPAAIVAYSWSGFYAGGNAGWSWGRATTDQTDSTSTTTVQRCFRDANSGEITGGQAVGICGAVFPITTGPVTTTAATSARANVDGFVGGVQAGYNYQFNRNWLAGIEADFQYSDQKGDATECSVTGCPAGSAFGSASHRLRWFGTLRGRLGWLPSDRILLYVTGGGAYGQIDSDYVSGINGTTLLAASNNQSRLGWTVGGGVEGAVGDSGWTLKVEYLYIDYGSFDTNFGTGAAVSTTGPCVVIGAGPACTRTTTTSTVSSTASTDFTDNIVRVGLNYRFGSSPMMH